MQQAATLPPKAHGVPILGNALDMRGDIAGFYVRLYREYGEVVRIQILQNEIYVMSGVDVNNWFVENQHLFSIREAFKSFEMIWGTQNHIVLQDGALHQRIRSTVRRSMATSVVTRNFEQLRAHLNDTIDTWSAGQEIAVWEFYQRLATEQLSLLIVNKLGGELFPHLRRIITWQLYVDLAQAMPAWVLKTPFYQRSLRKVRAFLMDIIVERRRERDQNIATSHRNNLTDDLLDAQAEDPEFWTDQALMAALGTPFLAGMDTVASTMSFLTYALLKHPEVLQACYEEVDRLYEEKGAAFGYNDLRKLRVIPAAIHETLRLYPIGVNATRMVVEDFVYNGYSILAGSFVYLPTVVPHFLEEYYPHPTRFDIQRDLKPPVKGAFAPFALGAHTCLGAGFGQAQLLATTVVLLHRVQLELADENFKMAMQATPVPNPGKDFAIRIRRARTRQT